MKKLVVAIACLFALSANLFAMSDRPVEVNQLPDKVQQFIATHFGFTEVSYAKHDTDLFDRSYTVVFTNGDKVEFYAGGEWEEIDCEHNAVPEALIPDFVKSFIDTKHKGQTVVELKKDKRRYDVKLKNGLELEFSQKGKFLKYD